MPRPCSTELAKRPPSDLLEVASVGQEDESLQDSDRIFADLVGRNVAPHESSNFQADALGKHHSGSSKGGSDEKRKGHILEISPPRRTQDCWRNSMLTLCASTDCRCTDWVDTLRGWQVQPSRKSE